MSILTLTTVDTAIINVNLAVQHPDADKASYATDPNVAKYTDLSDYAYILAENPVIQTGNDTAIDTQYRIAIEHPSTIQQSNAEGYHLPNDSRITAATAYSSTNNPQNFVALGANATSDTWVTHTAIDNSELTTINDFVSSVTPAPTVYINEKHKDNNLTLIPNEFSGKMIRPKTYAYTENDAKSYIYMNDPVGPSVTGNIANPKFGSANPYFASNAQVTFGDSSDPSDRVYCNIPFTISIDGTNYPISFTYNSGQEGKFTITYGTAPTSVKYNGRVVPSSDIILVQGSSSGYTVTLNLINGSFSNEDPRDIVHIDGSNYPITIAQCETGQEGYDWKYSGTQGTTFVIEDVNFFGAGSEFFAPGSPSSGGTAAHEVTYKTSSDHASVKVSVEYVPQGSTLRFETRRSYLVGSFIMLGGEKYIVTYNNSLLPDTKPGVVCYYPTSSPSNPSLPYPFVCDIACVNGLTEAGYQTKVPMLFVNPLQNQFIRRVRRTLGLESSVQTPMNIEIMNTRFSIQEFGASTITLGSNATSSESFAVKILKQLPQYTLNNAQYILVLPTCDSQKKTLIGQYFKGPYAVNLTYRFYLEMKKAGDTKWNRIIDSEDYSERSIDVLSTANDGPYKLKIIPCNLEYVIKPILFGFNNTVVVPAVEPIGKTFTILGSDFTALDVTDVSPTGFYSYLHTDFTDYTDLETIVTNAGNNYDLVMILPEQRVTENLTYIVSDDKTISYNFYQIKAPVSEPTVYFISGQGNDPLMKPFTYKGTTYSAQTSVVSRNNLPSMILELVSSGAVEGVIPVNAQNTVIFAIPDYHKPNVHYISKTTGAAPTSITVVEQDAFGTITASYTPTLNFVDLSLVSGLSYKPSLTPETSRFPRVYLNGASQTILNTNASFIPNTSSSILAPIGSYVTTSLTSFPYVVHGNPSISTNPFFQLGHTSNFAPQSKIMFYNGSNDILGLTDGFYTSEYVNVSSLSLGFTGPFFYKYESGATTSVNALTSSNALIIDLYKARQLSAIEHNIPTTQVYAVVKPDSATLTYPSTTQFDDKMQVLLATDNDNLTDTKATVLKTLNFPNPLSSELTADANSRPFDNNIDLYYYTSEEPTVEEIITFSYVNDVVTVEAKSNERDMISYLSFDGVVNGEKLVSLTLLTGTSSFFKTLIPYNEKHSFSTLIIGTDEQNTSNKLNFNRDFTSYNVRKFRFKKSGTSKFNEVELVPYTDNGHTYLGVKFTSRSKLNNFSFAKIGIVINTVTLPTLSNIQEFII